jgi:hypothetical protein
MSRLPQLALAPHSDFFLPYHTLQNPSVAGIAVTLDGRTQREGPAESPQEGGRSRRVAPEAP